MRKEWFGGDADYDGARNHSPSQKSAQDQGIKEASAMRRVAPNA
jgi:hypothetical protein